VVCLETRFKNFKNSIYGLNRDLILLFQGVGVLLGFSRGNYFSQLTIPYIILLIVGFGLCFGFIVWDSLKFKNNRILFKTDKATKAKTYAELTTNIASLSLMGIGAFSSAIRYYNYSFILYLLGIGLLVLVLVMYHDFLPEQVADESSIVPQQTLAVV
jgi:hypothetical protein